MKVVDQLTSEIVESKLDCPLCSSSDAYAIYDDGHGYCFSCQGYTDEAGTVERKERNVEAKPAENIRLPVGQTLAIPNRKLTLETVKKYGVTVITDADSNIVGTAYPYYDSDGNKCAVKIRNADKTFRIEGYIRNAQFFGAQLFKGGSKYITICEGEEDAEAAFQMMGSRYPFISIKTGVASALKECKENYEYLNSFDNIVIVFDSDQHGKVAAKKVAQLFPGKAKIVTLTEGKDASDYCVAGKAQAFTAEWWAGEVYTPASVLFGDALTKLSYEKPIVGVPLIIPALNDVTYGIRLHETWTLGAGTGLGKTELWKEIAYGLAIEQNKKCGIIFLEEKPARTWQCITGKDIGKRYYLEDVDASDEEIAAANEKLKDNFVIYDHNGDTDWDSIKAKIQYFVRSLGCEYIFLDHITALAEGKDEGNVNHRIHQIMGEINDMVNADPFSMFIISHLNQPTGTPHEEGGRVTLRNFYGSGAIKQRSNFVFALEGNQQAEGAERHLRYLRCLKDRNRGDGVGEVIPLQYSLDTGRLLEYDIDNGEEF